MNEKVFLEIVREKLGVLIFEKLCKEMERLKKQAATRPVTLHQDISALLDQLGEETLSLLHSSLTLGYGKKENSHCIIPLFLVLRKKL